MFNMTNEELTARKAIHTAREIHQQPEVWQEIFADIKTNGDGLRGFLEEIYGKFPLVRVIFTGAGSSAFTGDTIVPELRRDAPSHVSFEAIPTTDIVSNPTRYLKKEIPTILVSFARSGNSPESVAAVELGKQLIDEFYQVVITCNKDGQLARNVKYDEKSRLILLPEKSHDQGFAMTSSFTGMALAAYLLFSEKGFHEDEIKRITTSAKEFLPKLNEIIDELLGFEFERMVYLGSGSLGQLSHEASLKMLELTSGKVAAIHESSLGFRHGPKSILNDKSIVVLFLSSDPHTRKYDLDILKEIALGSPEVKVAALSEYKDEDVERLADWTIVVNEGSEQLESDFSLTLLYTVFAQSLAFKKSLQLGITPDNPSPDGRVNRVVQGVTIYPFHEG